MTSSNQFENNGMPSGNPTSITYTDSSLANLAAEYFADGSHTFPTTDLSPSKEPISNCNTPGNAPQLHSESESPPLQIGSWPSQMGIPCTPESPVQPTVRMPASATELTFSPSISLPSGHSPHQMSSLPGRNASGASSTTLSSSKPSGQRRLNWAEMICYTIYESPTGRLVIQELFEGMCLKFPEVTEWASGKDWEARVKNRIKSTLSIKGNLFVKVPRPSRAGSKGSWWTLTPEAQEAFRQGCLSEAVRGYGSLHSPNTARSAAHGPGTPTTARFGIGSNSINHDANPVRNRPSSFHGRTMQTSDLQGGWNRDFSEHRLSSNGSTTPYWRSNLRPQARRLAPLDLNNAAMQELFGDTGSAMMSPTTPCSVFSHGTAQNLTPQSATFPFQMSDTTFSTTGASTNSDSFTANASLLNTVPATKQPVNPALGLSTPSFDGSLSFSNSGAQELMPQPPISADIGQTDILGGIGTMDAYQQRNVLMMLNATSNPTTSLTGGVQGDLGLSGLASPVSQNDPASQNTVLQNIFQDNAQQLNFASNMNNQIPNTGYMNQLPGYTLPDQISFLNQMNATSTQNTTNGSQQYQQGNNPANGVSDPHSSSAVWNF